MGQFTKAGRCYRRALRDAERLQEEAKRDSWEGWPAADQREFDTMHRAIDLADRTEMLPSDMRIEDGLSSALP